MGEDNSNGSSTAIRQWLRPAIHPTYARLLCAHLYRDGFDPATVLAGTHLQWTQLKADRRYLSLAQMSRLVGRAVELTGRPWLGAELGDLAVVSVHGPLGYAAVSAPDIRAAIDVLTRFIAMRFAVVGVEAEEQGDACAIRLVEQTDLGRLREFVCGSGLATFLQLMNTVLAGQPEPLRLQWPQPRPDWARHYERRVNAEFEYNAPHLSITLPASVLDTPSLTADPHAWRTALRDCEAQQQRRTTGSLSQRVSDLLLQQQGGDYPSLEAMADTLAMSRRTLIRRLKAEDASYRHLLDDIRRELATWYLLESEWPVARIAEKLGYRDVSNFSRTFRRWFGTTPRAMRRK